MEPGLFGLIQRMTGQPDIDQQIAQAFNRAPGQAGGPPAGPLNPPPPGPAGGGGPTAGPAPAAGGPTAAPAAPPQPQAYQSSPDMMALYMQYGRQEQAAQMFNQGLAGLASSLSRSPDRAKYLSMGQYAPMDPGATFGNLMKLRLDQQQQQRLAAFNASTPDLAKKFNMTPQEIFAAGPDVLEKAVQLGVPPEVLRVRTALQQQYIGDHANDPDPNNPGQKLGPDGARAQFERENPMALTMAAASGGASVDPQRVQMTADLNDWRNNPDNAGKPPPFNDTNSWALWKARTAQQGTNRNQAQEQFHDLDANLSNYAGTLANVANDPKLGGILGGGIIGQFVGNKLPLTSEAYPLYTKITNLQEQTKALGQQGGSLTKGSLLPLGTSAADLTKFALPEDDYRTSVISPLMRQTLTAMANNYGAAGRTDEMPGYLKPYLDPIYQPKGELYVKSPYPKAVPQPQKGMTPLTPDDLTEFKGLMENYGPQKALEIFRSEKKDTSSLE